MPLIFSLQRFTHLRRRALALAMLVLQVGMALAPLADRPGRRTVTHVEQRGTRHARTHNEATCVVCAIQSFRSVTVSPPPVAVVQQMAVPCPIAVLECLTSRAPPTQHGSRAPPIVS